MKQILSEKFNTKLAPDTAKELKEMADYEGRTVGGMGRVLILAGLKSFKQSKQKAKNAKLSEQRIANQ